MECACSKANIVLKTIKTTITNDGLYFLKKFDCSNYEVIVSYTGFKLRAKHQINEY
jgi:hypothetical protein